MKESKEAFQLKRALFNWDDKKLRQNLLENTVFHGIQFETEVQRQVVERRLSHLAIGLIPCGKDDYIEYKKEPNAGMRY